LSSRILVVDDERNIRRVLQALLEDEGYDVDSASDGDEARGMLRRAQLRYDVVLTDLRMPGCDGMELLRWAQGTHPDTPIVMITAHGTVDIAVEAMRAGAFDFITKPFEEAELSAIVSKALAHREANRRRAYAIGTTDPAAETLETEIPAPGDDDHAQEVLGEIIGVSAAMKEVFALLRKVAPSPTTILIRGESGTGKELVADAIHRLSQRSEGPFIAVNCTAIPESLFESELFGHEKGAFTGAVTSRPGRFELAHKGTLFLDEIGELPAAMQVKLLRALQERINERVGGMAATPVDVRLIAATNADLETMVEAGTFREDLFYRLNVVPIRLPPLRARPSDIPVLLRHFIAKFSERLQRNVDRISPDAEMTMVRYPWPGNIRQLENVVERMVLLSENPSIEVDDLPAEVREGRSASELGLDSLRDEPVPEGNLKEIVKVHTQQVERELIMKALEADTWNVTQAAKRLGISRKGLQMKMKEYDLRDKSPDSRAAGDPVEEETEQ
tara:strand:- start:566 stop:2074 length:1509 start_codon:yes stop_codon:yes gene_type:complete